MEDQDDRMIKLKSKDEQVLELTADAASISDLVRDSLTDAKDDDPIEILRVSSDLYEDLMDTKVAAVATGRKKSASSSSSKGPQSFAEQVETFQQRVQALERENLTLKRNMGTLFRTAKRELERKDAEMQRLQQELDQHSSG